MTWQRSAIDCTDCGGRALARTNQWGEVTHYECKSCGAEHEV